MRKLIILTAGVALLSAASAFAQSSADRSSAESSSQGRSVGHSSGHARPARRAPPAHAIASRPSRDVRSSETCSQELGPTTDHETSAAATSKSPGGPPPPSGAVEPRGGSASPCPPQRRS